MTHSGPWRVDLPQLDLTRLCRHRVDRLCGMLKSLSIATALWAHAACATFAQSAGDLGRVVGTVRDSASGRPLVGAFVAAQLMLGRARTDSRGHFALSQVTPGVQQFELNCPSRTLLGRQLLAKRVRVPAHDSAIVDLRVDSSLCDEPPYREVKGEFRGFYSTGFEHSAFSVCADTALGIPPRPARAGDDDGWSEMTAWVSFTDQGLADWRRFQASPAADSAEAVERRGFGARYVRWHGTLTGPGSFGHMGVSDYQIIVDRVVYLGSGDARVCRQPPDNKR